MLAMMCLFLTIWAIEYLRFPITLPTTIDTQRPMNGSQLGYTYHEHCTDHHSGK